MSENRINLKKIDDKSEDIFEAAIIIGKRARQIISERIMKNEIHSFEKDSELNEEEFNEIKDEIGMNYVEMTKATSVAIDEFCNDEIDWKYEEKDIEE
mgnify:CR=1 FL=1